MNDMSFFKKLFNKQTPDIESVSDKKEVQNPRNIESYEDFWNWFLNNEKKFYQTIKEGKNIEHGFFNFIGPKLNELRSGFWYLTGMKEENLAELIITPDGNLKNFVFVQELVDSAPKPDNWVFTAFKPELSSENCQIDFAGIPIGANNLFFEPIEDHKYPDDISVRIICSDYSDENSESIESGISIFLDNFLGEVKFSLDVDFIEIEKSNFVKEESIPIEKLKDYIIWRKKEFIEKYGDFIFLKELDDCAYYNLEASTPDSLPLLASINEDIINWEHNVSHPYILKIEINYKGNESQFPDQETFDRLNAFEDSLNSQLEPKGGFLNIGRTLGENKREIYVACKDFCKGSKECDRLLKQFKFDNSSYEVFKDKYWRCVNYLRKPI